ncbi:hypothetical protein [Aquimarina mytili]|uniref:Uncharacterized protein n=1 Tax=Aquimarina mytili TaxID=874423 RepID=A0A937A4R8_9FLAO|nr:hypothetical protein [Aquimarina mytili]MBL0684319.1 hypothetical protein [Aquimarina mytili]
MNPLVVAQGISSAKSFFSNRKVQIVLLLIVLYFIFKKKIKRFLDNRRLQKFQKDEGSIINQLAQQYRAAFNPSGISWMINFDTTKTQAIERLAYQTKGRFQAIANAYELRYKELLTDRLRRELSADEFQNWQNIVD